MVLGFLMLLGALVVIITVLFLSIRDSEMEENEGARGSSGKGGGGGSNVLVVPQAPAPPTPPVVPQGDTGSSNTKATRRPTPPPRTPTPTTPTTPTTPRTTTTPPLPLLCSVGTQTAISKRFPPDRLCDIVIYTHVRVFKKTVIGAVSDISYHAFRNACSTYVDTSCGLSFDVRYLEQDMFQTVQVRDDLTAMKEQRRVYHYGILNIIEEPAQVENLATVIAPAILKVMRRLLGSNRERDKVFVGVGYYFYNEKNAWSDLEYTAENLALPEVDIVVILSTTVTMPSPAECFTLPVNVYKSRDLHPATLDKAYRMATSQFSRPEIVVALALQMGVAVYNLSDQPSSANNALYKPCTGFGISDYSQACQVPETDLNIEKTAVGLATRGQFPRLQEDRLLAFDTLSHLIDKATIIMQKPDVRTNLTWLLLNADLTDPTRQCLREPFERVKEFRDFYYRRAQMPTG
ncbi:uncharacterized protein LOC142587014 [Dermacentor variabilis]|uniref:uncharacterized protein LOC142587014 n=1 Tax=Dermacentor variabilis TaxID=34621 RepID=UPI003F5C6926